MEFDLKTLLTFFSGLLGVAAGYGALRARALANAKALNKLQKSWNAFHGQGTNPGADPVYIRRTECKETRDRIENSIGALDETVTTQGECIQRLENFARWQLTTKEGLSLSEANDILENGN